MGKLREIKVIVIDPNQIATRDWLIVELIMGVTKAGTFTDKRKETNRKHCRQRIHKEDY
jgi:hypothetical protein